MKKLLALLLSLACMSGALADGNISVVGVTAQQRYPWNGNVDIFVTMQGDMSQVANVECIFAATNCRTMVSLNIAHVSQVGDDSVDGDVCVRHYLWNAKQDVGEAKIEMILPLR